MKTFTWKLTKNVENGGAVGALLGGVLAHNNSTSTGKIEKVCDNFNILKSDQVGSKIKGYIGGNEYEIKKTNQKEIEFTLECGFTSITYTFNITHDDTDKQKLTDFLKRRIS